MSKNALCNWDITTPINQFENHMDLVKLLHKHCKKWSFQKEKGDKTGYIHYQIRISLKTKQRLTGLSKIFPKSHFSPTSNENKNNNFYVLKEDTRIDGPWTDEMDLIPNYVPRQIRNITLYPWQQTIVDMSKQWDTRHINIIIDNQGNIGKSILVTYMGVNKLANNIPFCNDYKDILRMVMDRPKRGVYLIDMPRAINKERLFQLFSAIETIKSGYAFDDRYNFREEYFDCPNIFVFTNNKPDNTMLSNDRWKYWTVSNKELIEFKEN